ncbi:Telomerase activating protein Est1 [Teratosphaeria destructans]|uniref:Telomerase activating protein Est1 n=1 Tax=Teratosphaeria destructans TaxID=418781 RepID=A0A9W7SPT9_9PEZI|nr:Telomerase activating protein Est1 [Teratosphaeria destructans]
MEAALAEEQARGQHVQQLLRDTASPIVELFTAFAEYRALCRAIIIAQPNQEVETRLWEAHTTGRKYLSRALGDLRKQGESAAVSARQLTRLYLQFLKESERFYRGYIHLLHHHYRLPELEAIAQQVQKSDVDMNGSESPFPVSSELRAVLLRSCHQSLIYLGDLARYRATDKLDKEPKFGPAIGWYDLAGALIPTNGHGHHQQAIVELAQPKSQRNELRVIYHLYRSMVVDEPNPNAFTNLSLEFEKTSRDWTQNKALVTGNGPDAPKRLLIGWFVRMHSMCYKGEEFGAYRELEQTLLRQLANVVKSSGLDAQKTVSRMAMVNMAAQYNAINKFTSTQEARYQQALFYFFRFNISFYTSLLQLLDDNLVDPDAVSDDEDPAAKLTGITRCVLPALHLYSAWMHAYDFLLDGLKQDEFLVGPIDTLWYTYCKVLNALASDSNFGIWTLEDYQSTYLLQEDADALGFNPLKHQHTAAWPKRWYDQQHVLKPRFSDSNVARLAMQEEDLSRLNDILVEGLKHCEADSTAPLTLLGTKVYHGPPPEEAVKAAEEAKRQPPRPMPKPKPLSYAKAAAKSQAAAAPVVRSGTASSTGSRVQQAHLSRMVHDLVDEDDVNDPVTPPQQFASAPTILTNGESHMHNGGNGVEKGFSAVPSYQPKAPVRSPIQHARPVPAGTPRTSIDRLRSESVSGLWPNQSPVSPSFPPGLLMGTMSPGARGHSRGDSAGSTQSKASQNGAMGGDSYPSFDPTPGGKAAVRVPYVPVLAREGPIEPIYNKFSDTTIASPLLFGTGGVWSTNGRATNT